MPTEAQQYNEDDWLDVFGPRIKTLSRAPDRSAGGYALLLGIMPAGVAVPLHSHEDRETMYVLSGAVEVYVRGEWRSVSPNSVVDIKSNEPHAWRNVTSKDATLIIVTTAKMERFFAKIGRPIGIGSNMPTLHDMERLVTTSKEFGYWMAAPDENLAIGVNMSKM
jgi:mannose-6-phosphate isomerase-like protein (cupin superfamily)